MVRKTLKRRKFHKGGKISPLFKNSTDKYGINNEVYLNSLPKKLKKRLENDENILIISKDDLLSWLSDSEKEKLFQNLPDEISESIFNKVNKVREQKIATRKRLEDIKKRISKTVKSSPPGNKSPAVSPPTELHPHISSMSNLSLGEPIPNKPAKLSEDFEDFDKIFTIEKPTRKGEKKLKKKHKTKKKKKKKTKHKKKKSKSSQ